MFKQILIITLISLFIVFIFFKKKDLDILEVIKQKKKNYVKGKKYDYTYKLEKFYTDTPWTITPDGKSNYIHDINNDKFYIIEPGYLYNIINDDIKVYIENRCINIFTITN